MHILREGNPRIGSATGLKSKSPVPIVAQASEIRRNIEGKKNCPGHILVKNILPRMNYAIYPARVSNLCVAFLTALAATGCALGFKKNVRSH